MNKNVGLVKRICDYKSALSEPQRVKLMNIMGSYPDNPASVSELAKILRTSRTQFVDFQQQTGTEAPADTRDFP